MLEAFTSYRSSLWMQRSKSKLAVHLTPKIIREHELELENDKFLAIVPNRITRVLSVLILN